MNCLSFSTMTHTAEKRGSSVIIHISDVEKIRLNGFF